MSEDSSDEPEFLPDPTPPGWILPVCVDRKGSREGRWGRVAPMSRLNRKKTLCAKPVAVVFWEDFITAGKFFSGWRQFVSKCGGRVRQ